MPATKEANSSKSDSLPDIDVYFDRFSSLQYEAVQTALKHKLNSKLLDDYIMLLKAPSLSSLQTLSYDHFRAKLLDSIAPQVHLARSMGFSIGWVYANDLQVTQES
ncbi:hypothetical protein HRbin16_02308 [bacterium HR16]|nr:hypothetical protein HRbin16_02308 [bacterium HR16]